MKKIITTLITALLALAFTLSVTACGDMTWNNGGTLDSTPTSASGSETGKPMKKWPMIQPLRITRLRLPA